MYGGENHGKIFFGKSRKINDIQGFCWTFERPDFFISLLKSKSI